MGTYRMFADDNGISRCEDIDLEQVSEWTKGIDVTQNDILIYIEITRPSTQKFVITQ